MKAPLIRNGTKPPQGDGELNLWAAPDSQFVIDEGQNWFDSSRRAIFVNGMLNTPEDHVESALRLSLFRACPVVGVYNLSRGGLRDFWQCITDKLTLTNAQGDVTSFRGMMKTVDDFFDRAREKAPSLDRRDFVEQIISGNAATVALYRLLVGDGGFGKRVPIFCHSQGNLITSNALTAAALALGEAAIQGLEVTSFGSPCSFWPPGINRSAHAFTLDPVTVFDGRIEFSSSKVGFVGARGIVANFDPFYAHGFLRYLQYEGEFIVNRFRWGALRMTASMDEEGLASFCVKLGNNPRVLAAVFTRLEAVHQTDADDVALEYCEQASDALLLSIAASDPGVIRQLIRMLETGFVTWGELAQITRLYNLL